MVSRAISLPDSPLTNLETLFHPCAPAASELLHEFEMNDTCLNALVIAQWVVRW